MGFLRRLGEYRNLKMNITSKSFFLMLAFLTGSAEAVTDTFLVSGSWVAPAGVTSVTLEAWGGGGAGGGATGNPAKGGGGAGGQYASKVITVTPGSTYTVVVGTGGTGSTGNGTAGGDSTFNTNGVVAKGGAGGSVGSVNNGTATAGLGSSIGGVGTTVFAGGNGSDGLGAGTGGAGGGGAGSGGLGGNASGNTVGSGTATGGGAGAAPMAGSCANAAVVAGGGGCGGYATTTTDRSGGVGAAGMVTITYSPALVALYTLDDQTWNDSSGNGYNGAVGGFSGTAPTFSSVFPALGNSTTGTCGYRAFNRPDKTYIYLPSSFPNMGASGAAFTITAWIRTTDNTQPGQRILIDDENNSSGYGFSLGDNGTGMIRFFTRGTPSALILDTPNVIANNTWYFVAAVADVPTKTKHIYVFNTAGTLLSHVTATWTEASFGSDVGVVSIGGETNASGENTGAFGFAGNLDEIRVYSNALTQTDLATVQAITHTCPANVVTPGLFNACEVTSPQCTPTAIPAVSYAALTTKQVGQSFTLDGVAILSGGTLNSSFNKSVQVDLLANTSTGVSIDSNNCPVSQTATIALGNKTFASGRATINSSTATPITIGTAYGEVRVKYTCSGANCGTAITACSTGSFAVNPAGPDHIEFVHDGSALTCTPKAITVLGCTTSASCNGVSANQFSSVSFPISLTSISGATWCADSLCATTLTSPATVTNGTVIYLKDTNVRTDQMSGTGSTASNTIIQCTNTSNSTFNATTACNVAFAASGFLVSLPSHVAGTNSTLTVQAVKASNNALGCVPVFSNQTRTEAIKFAYSNPSTGTIVPTVGGIAISTGGSGVNLSFDSTGTATPTFVYKDVGMLSITVTDPSLPMTGSTSTLPIIAPSSFSFTSITAGPIRSGNSFNATVTALNALGTSTPNFGKETTPEGVTLSHSKYQPTGVGAALGIFSGSLGSFNNGAAVGVNLNWNEVGTIDLRATLASGSYLGSGLTATGITGTTGAVGRFIPDHFDTAIINGCLSCAFTYSGEPFTVYVTAKNGLATATTTVNYDGTASTTPNFAKALTLTAWDAATGATQNPNGSLLPPGNTSVPLTAFSQGIASLSTSATMPFYTFTTVPTIPTFIRVRAIDTDNVSSLRVPLSSSIEGLPEIRSGRIKITNALGSELLQLPIAVTAQYLNASSSYVNSTSDSSSSFVVATPTATSSVSFGNFQKNLTTISVKGSPKTVTLSSGVGGFILSAPGAGNIGSVDMSIPGLTGASCYVFPTPLGCYLPSNTARATFGVYKGANEFIYFRENY
jgi:hypothetical protein